MDDEATYQRAPYWQKPKFEFLTNGKDGDKERLYAEFPEDGKAHRITFPPGADEKFCEAVVDRFNAFQRNMLNGRASESAMENPSGFVIGTMNALPEIRDLLTAIEPFLKRAASASPSGSEDAADQRAAVEGLAKLYATRDEIDEILK